METIGQEERSWIILRGFEQGWKQSGKKQESFCEVRSFCDVTRKDGWFREGMNAKLDSFVVG